MVTLLTDLAAVGSSEAAEYMYTFIRVYPQHMPFRHESREIERDGAWSATDVKNPVVGFNML